MNVLIACEFSGTVRDAFLVHGHNAISCDLEPSEKPGPHIQGSVLPLLEYKWDLVIAHPPCTYLANSGVRWLAGNSERQRQLKMAASFFYCFLNYTGKIAIENPVMHKHAGIRKSDFTVQPWQFGDAFKKRTCWWTQTTLDRIAPSQLVTSKARGLIVRRTEVGSIQAWLRRLLTSGV